MPPLTVAIPTYNGARHLAEAIRSIRAQSDLEFDFLICDDRSDDETPALARSEGGDRLRFEVNSERLGLAGNWNRCVDLSRTEWVAIFHQDDIMRCGHLAGHLATIRDDPGDLGLIAGRGSVIDDSGRPVDPSIVDPGGEIDASDGVRNGDFARFPPGSFVGSLSASNPLRCSAVTTRKSAHQAVGGFDPSYRYVVDWDFWLRVARKYAVAWLDGQPTVAVRWHPSSETHRFKVGTADLEETSRLLDSISSPDRRRADRRLARAYLNRAYDAAKLGDRSLSRLCLGRAVRTWPGILGRIAVDPRLMARLVLGKSR